MEKREVLIESASLGYFEIGEEKIFLNIVVGAGLEDKNALDEIRAIFDKYNLNLVVTITDDEFVNALVTRREGSIVWTKTLVEVLQQAKEDREEFIRSKYGH
jgi:hypothetical protein